MFSAQALSFTTEGVVHQWTETKYGTCRRYEDVELCSGPIFDNVCGYQCPIGSTCKLFPEQGASRCCRTERRCVEQDVWTCTHFDGQCSGTWTFWNPYRERCVIVDGVSQCTTGYNQFPWIIKCSNGHQEQNNAFCMW
ncbi:hypothetical protein BO221_07240 [Archangium sp. Cb G35]|nr:hypothetical protein BO221_07240 [Archangium sp. Cb G35]